MNKKKVGIFGLMAFALTALVTPTVASAQEPCRDLRSDVMYRRCDRHEDWRFRHIRERRRENRRYYYHY
jgi:hypothetical protein